MSSQNGKQRSDDSNNNIVAFPQLNKKKSSTNSLSQFSLSSKVSTRNENDGDNEARIPNINSVLSLSAQTQLSGSRQEQQYDPDDGSAGTWGSDSSDYSSSLDEEDDALTFGVFNGDSQRSQARGTSGSEQATPWPVFAGFPSTDSKKGRRGSNGVDVATSTNNLSHSPAAVRLDVVASQDAQKQLDSVLRGSAELTPSTKVKPSAVSLGTGAITEDAIVDAQKRFFAVIGGMGGLSNVLGVDISKAPTTTKARNEENEVDSIHGMDPDSVYKNKSKRKEAKKDLLQGVPIMVPTKNPDSPSLATGGIESIDTLYFSADDGLDPFERKPDTKSSVELCTTTHAVVSRADLEVDSSYDGSCSFADDDTDFGGETSALHVEFSPPRELLHSSTDSIQCRDDQRRTAFQANPDFQNLAQNFAMEHRIFLKAMLELLGQRDKYATEVGMNDPHTIKSGPLKKASHLIKGIWKVKYVEIRRGMFSYYEDALSNTSTHQGELLRKNIPLEANSCTCRAVKLHHKALNLAPGGAIFELTVNQGPKRLWMANSREERGAWINAIHDAMVGGSVARGDPRGKTNASSAKNVFQRDVKKYMKTHNLIKHAKTKNEYVRALRELLGLSLSIPIHWLMEQVESEHTGFHEEAISSGVDQLWKDLIRDSVRINGEMFVGKTGHAPERIVGALMRSIMNCNRKAVAESKITSAAASKYHLTESQALAYSRDVLLSGNRTRSGGDSYYCVDTLCSSPGLVVTVPNSSQAEPVSVTVSKQVDDLSAFYSVHDKSGWLRTRTRWAQRWRKRYFVLSEGTLSFYEKAVPRPHGLQGQIVLVDATIFVKKDEENTNGVRKKHFIVTIVAKDGLTLKERERQLLFENEEKFVVWSSTLEGALKQKLGDDCAPSPNAVKSVLRRLGHGRDDGQSFYGHSLAEKSLKDHAPSLGLDSEAIERQLALYARTSCATVKVSVEASTEYKICTTDPQGDDREDTWATIRTVYLQDFQVSGGPSGRFIRGEEIVQVNVVDCPGEEIPPILTPPAPPSPRAGLLSISKGRRLFRHITGDDYEPLDE